MTNLFAVSSLRSIGCSFLNWSIHFIHGDIEFYNVLDGWGQLPTNPMTERNAHGFLKNHPCGWENTQNYIDSLKSLDTSRLLSLYPYCYPDNPNEYISMVNLIINNNVPLIYMDLPCTPLYFSTPARCRWGSADESLAKFIEEYFTNSENYNLDNIWEFREFAALNLRPFDILPINLDLTNKHLYINAMDMWFNGEEKIKEIFEFLSLHINNTRLNEWMPIYRQWQSIHSNILKFAWNIYYIIYCIIAGAVYVSKNLQVLLNKI